MKNIAMTCLILLTVCINLQAKKVVKTPYYLAAGTTQIEVERVILDKDTTWVDVRIYQMPGMGVRIDSTAVLRVGEKKYAYWGGDGFSGEYWTRVPASGELPATLKFEPLPMDAESFDFIEMPNAMDEGWNIFGVRLDGKKPQIDVPEELLNRKLDYSLPLPEPVLKNGNSVIRGKILGYNPAYGVGLNITSHDWFFFTMFGYSIPVAEDGTFCYETNLLLPGGASLRVGNKKITLFMVPGGELEITLNLPEVYWSESRLLKKKASGECVWFGGTYAGLNTELLKYGSLMEIAAAEGFFDNICGMTPAEYKKYVVKIYEKNRKEIMNGKALSDAARVYMLTNLEMSYFSAINGFKSNISYAPMITGKKGVKRADMTVDEHYFDDILKLDFIHSPLIRLGSYPDFIRAAKENFKGKIEPEPIWDDILRAKPLGFSLVNLKPLTEAQLLTLDSIAEPEIRKALEIRNSRVTKALAESARKTGYTVCELDKSVSADSLLAVITRPYRGKVVLVDMWNTWCGPCMRAMQSLKPVKEELKDVVYIYVADESSPEGRWKITIPDIRGIHYRITNEQSAALGKLYEYPGIPTYFVIDREGKLAYKVTGFPGAETMREELNKL